MASGGDENTKGGYKKQQAYLSTTPFYLFPLPLPEFAPAPAPAAATCCAATAANKAAAAAAAPAILMNQFSIFCFSIFYF